MKASDFFLPVSRYLSDQLPGDEYARWTKEDLFDAFQWAVRWIAASRPGFFVKNFSVTLVEGTHQQLPPGCLSITDTVNNLRRITHSSMRLVAPCRIHPRGAKSLDDYEPSEFVQDGDRDPNSFFIYPPVPSWAVGKKFDFLGTYAPNVSSPDDEIIVNPTMEGVIESLMIYYIGTGENESATLKQVARLRFEDAQTAIGLDIRNEDRQDRRERQQEVRDRT